MTSAVTPCERRRTRCADQRIQHDLRLFTGDAIDAAEALRIGLVSYVTPHADLMPRTLDLAGRIAANPPLALASLKDGLRRVTFGDPHEVGAWAITHIHRLFATEDHREGVRSFLERRPPVFHGR